MKVIAFNGSARKNGNTIAMLDKALEGAASAGAETELINIYDLDIKGCRGCFGCKRIGSASYGSCVVKDDMAEVTKRALEADALLFGSPIYFGDVTGEMRVFFERLLYPKFCYDNVNKTLWPKKIKAGFIYTMGVPDEAIYREALTYSMENIAVKVFGEAKSMYVTFTKHIPDYSGYHTPSIDAIKKQEHYDATFAEELNRAYEFGRGLVGR